MVFAFVLLAELFALVLALAEADNMHQFWQRLGMVSMFVQGSGLLGITVLSYSRGWLSRVGLWQASALAFGMLLLAVGLFSELSFYLFIVPTEPHLQGQHVSFLGRNMLIGAVVSGIVLHYFYIQHQSQRRYLAESEARIQALQARIRPHFLFNSINTAASLIDENPGQAEEALLDLADLFRASIGEQRALIPLADEMALVRHYLHIESLRLGERLQVCIDLDGVPQELLVPPLSLQPLVENAVYHGIEPLTEGGEVRIEAILQETAWCIQISNPVHDGNDEREGLHMAMDNIRERLAMQFTGKAHLESSREEGLFRVRLHLPKLFNEASS